MKLFRKNKKISEDDDFFIALSDIMTALMLLFLLISVVYMIKVEDSVKIPKIFKETTQGLSEHLNKEFEKDLKAWGAVLDKDLTIRFYQPDILFKTGSDVLSPKFKNILNDFFPRYLKIMMDKQFINNIEEIRIDGHTSSFWGNIKGDIAYLNNMELSQARTREVIKYLLNLNLNEEEKEWLKKHFRAIGFSSAKPLNDKSQTLQYGEKENFIKSQRVEFRVRTNIENKIVEVVDK
ncbi:OmpA/MotB family protein [Campylobacter insulaenigrae]|uniref:OmpA/MotB family protein n=1 Tax=Campylobacter insulaenigrae TaxID=260714 RepID=UPI0021537CA6|nr:OmpA family protein [Campylobacter insulaenigrae]MCR6576804.1 OmpA family protein [Campylobacter insulaenigrae]